MKKLYKTIIPKRIRQKIKERETYGEYEKLRKIPGHVYRRFDETQSIFIHIPKAGGISTIKSLYGEEAGGFGHPTYERFLRLYGEKHFNTYFKFTFVRNPWERLLSAYSFLKKGGMNHMDQQFCNEVLSDYGTFEKFVMEWVDEENVESWVHFIPQYHYVYDADMNLVVDFVGRFENFNKDFEKVRSILKTGTPLKHLNKTGDKKAKSYRDAYTPEMAEKVAKVYKIDIELFGYAF